MNSREGKKMPQMIGNPWLHGITVQLGISETFDLCYICNCRVEGNKMLLFFPAGSCCCALPQPASGCKVLGGVVGLG